MKKYIIAERIGCFLISLAMIIALISMTIDLDYNDDAWKYMLIGFGIALSLGLIGLSLLYLVTVEGVLIAVFVLILATIYRIIKAPVRILRICYTVKVKYGDTYRSAFLKCVDMYDRYIDKKKEEGMRYE